MDESLYLVLGCFGRSDEGFVNCSGIENRILLISPLAFNYEKLMDYLDGCRLFEKASFDYTAIRNIICHIYDNYSDHKPIWSRKLYEQILKFTISHRDCGLCLKLVIASTQQEIILPQPPEHVYIASMQKNDQEKTLIAKNLALSNKSRFRNSRHIK